MLSVPCMMRAALQRRAGTHRELFQRQLALLDSLQPLRRRRRRRLGGRPALPAHPLLQLFCGQLWLFLLLRLLLLWSRTLLSGGGRLLGRQRDGHVGTRRMPCGAAERAVEMEKGAANAPRALGPPPG